MIDPVQKPIDQKISQGTWVLFSILGVLLLLSIAGFWFAVTHVEIPQISLHGWVAMSIGIVFSLAIGGGLMWLSFYSSRQGFDDRADPGRFRTKKDTSND